jgi:hypothetical protein
MTTGLAHPTTAADQPGGQPQSPARQLARGLVHALFAPVAPTPLTSAPRTKADRWIEAAVLVLYAAILATAVRHHLPGDDESQAWLLARDSSLRDLLLYRMHYEGAPGLWPLLLWLTSHGLHLPFAALGWLGAAFAFAGIAVLVMTSPLPRAFRWLLPFSYFLLYQYAVIARPYTLFPLLLFLLCQVYSLRRPRPLLFAAIAGLLINLSLSAAVIGGCFALLYAYEQLRRDGPACALLPAISLLLASCLSSAMVAIPAPDVVLIGDSASTFKRSELQSTSPLARLLPTQMLPRGVPPLDPLLDMLAEGQRRPNSQLVLSMPGRLAAQSLVYGADSLTFPIARSNLLAMSLLAACLLWLSGRRQLRLTVPYFVTILVSVNCLTLDHHTGQFLLALIAALWIALTRPAPQPQPVRNALLSALALLVLCLQIGWSAHTIAYERTHAYDPGRETAAWLTQHLPHGRIAAFSYETVSTQPYSASSLYLNWPTRYWLWSAPVYIDRRRSEALAQHPDAVVVAGIDTREQWFYNQWTTFSSPHTHLFGSMLDYWIQNGYKPAQTFCGERLMRGGVAAELCETVLLPTESPTHQAKPGDR